MLASQKHQIRPKSPFLSEPSGTTPLRIFEGPKISKFWRFGRVQKPKNFSRAFGARVPLGCDFRAYGASKPKNFAPAALKSYYYKWRPFGPHYYKFLGHPPTPPGGLLTLYIPVPATYNNWPPMLYACESIGNGLRVYFLDGFMLRRTDRLQIVSENDHFAYRHGSSSIRFENDHTALVYRPKLKCTDFVTDLPPGESG